MGLRLKYWRDKSTSEPIETHQGIHFLSLTAKYYKLSTNTQTEIQVNQ